MVKLLLSCFYTLCLALALFCTISESRKKGEIMMKSAVYHSPEFEMQPGSVVNRFYYNIDFPRGHIGIKSFNAEVVDDTGEAVPLHNTYLHHWVVVRYYQRVSTQDNSLNQSVDAIFVRNSGVCHNLGQYFGLGSETRRTETRVPDPYAIQVGNPADIPPGYEERWMLNVHAIDTRGAVDKLGCTECKCSLYNVTIDEFDRPISPDYEGGLYCCYDKTQCKVKRGFEHSPRKLYLRYTVNWFDWNESLLPVRIYIFDITDTLRTSEDSTEVRHECKIEYEVQPCDSSVMPNDRCTDNKRFSFSMPEGGYVIYGAAHQHSGGIGSALYREDGRVVCASIPIYGNGEEAGNEAGYIVGMSTCYPKPGSLVINTGEALVLESNYSSSRKHTGVMGLFYILVADQLPRQTNFGDALLSKVEGIHMDLSGFVVLFVGIVAVGISAFTVRRRNRAVDGYEPVSM
ncbi:uncharacterized protein LOC141601802 [Silene latifolia]|uniref:uncharacterized protein LOC141601802 n=1 Tax=Silene latifolia TaxID=37657 RepID=UPI003D780A1B